MKLWIYLYKYFLLVFILICKDIRVWCYGRTTISFRRDEVFDFDGPFDQDVWLGHAEINFLKHTSSELVDIWVMLEGKLGQSSQSKLQLRIFLDNNNGVETMKEYLEKMEKE